MPELILLCGIPGAGKSTYADNYVKSHENHIRISSDSIRKELYGSESVQECHEKVFSLMQSRTLELIKSGASVLYDATNITRKSRSNIINMCQKHADISCHIIWAPIETCIKRDAERERTVGIEIITKMLKRFQAPYYNEGISNIKIILPNDFTAENQFAYERNCCNNMKIPHDNPHHALDVYQHCIEAKNFIHGKFKSDNDLVLAAKWHDIGKPFCKSFTDIQGNKSDIAHYYQHHCVGAYMSYGLSNTNPTVAWLISTHMDPFLTTSYWKNLEPKLKEKIDLLHEADLAAH